MTLSGSEISYSFSLSLAQKIGLTEAVLIDRLQTLLSEDRDDPRLVWIDGQCWLVATYRSLRSREFPFFGIEAVRLAMKNLNRLEILISDQKPYDATQQLLYWHHRIDPFILAEFLSGTRGFPRKQRDFVDDAPTSFPYQSQLENPHLHFHSRLMDVLPYQHKEGSRKFRISHRDKLR